MTLTLPFWFLQSHTLNVGKVAAAAKSLQSCPTLCDPIDGSPPGFSVPGILQARTLEWVAICISTEGGVGSVPGGGTKIANAAV